MPFVKEKVLFHELGKRAIITCDSRYKITGKIYEHIFSISPMHFPCILDS